jgi:predicted porin
MKKSLFAIAAVTAFAGAAQAQSSVTVYGVLDMGFAGGNYKAVGTSVSKSTSGLSVQQAAQSTSRIGFRGTEDLGGGTQAFFTFETGLTPNGTSNSAGSLSTFNNRQAFIGLAQKGIGRTSMGTQQTFTHAAVGRTTAGGQNNLVGDLIYTVNGNAGGAAMPTNTSYGMTAGNSYVVRLNNTIKFETETMAGFQANALAVLQGTDATQTNSTTGGTTSNTGYELSLNYTFKKLFLTANYASYTNRTSSAVQGTAPVGLAAGTAPTFAVFGAGANAVMGTNVDDNTMYGGATYDFGILQGFASYINRKATANSNNLYFGRYTAQQIGVRSNLTKTVNVFASVSTGAFENLGYDTQKANINGYQLGTNYVLSKRTNLYAMMGNVSQSTAANSGTVAGGNPATAANTSFNANNYAIGMRHTF